MSNCRCRTINLAVMSLDSLKQIECKTPKATGLKPKNEVCKSPGHIPPSPSPISKKKIIVCSPRPVTYHCHPLPCVCPPCPPCETYPQMVVRFIKTGAKLFVFYSFVKWTADQKLWDGHKGTSRITLEFMEKNFPDKYGHTSLPDIQRLKFNLLNQWDRLIGNIFYYLVAFPLKLLSTPAIPEDKINWDSDCECS